MPQDAPPHHNDSLRKTEDTIARLTKLLDATPSAEELSQSWARSSSETLQRDGPRLQDLRRAVDAGKVIRRSSILPRGIPMWIVVRMCKATWHRDGTWPLLGADEEASEAVQSMGVVRSIHPSALILRPEGTTCFQIPLEDADADIRIRSKTDPTAENIADSYRARGVHVDPAVSTQDDW